MLHKDSYSDGGDEKCEAVDNKTLESMEDRPNVGVLNFTVEYRVDKAVFMVTIHRASYLPAKVCFDYHQFIGTSLYAMFGNPPPPLTLSLLHDIKMLDTTKNRFIWLIKQMEYNVFRPMAYRLDVCMGTEQKERYLYVLKMTLGRHFSENEVTFLHKQERWDVLRERYVF